jgi:hypothetical protein
VAGSEASAELRALSSPSPSPGLAPAPLAAGLAFGAAVKAGELA